LARAYEARARLCLLLGRGARLPTAPRDAIASPGFAGSPHPGADRHRVPIHSTAAAPMWHMNKNNSGPYIGRDRLYGGIQITELRLLLGP